MDSPQVPICIIPTGLPAITTPTSIPSPTSYLYQISTSPRSFKHLVVFLIPGIELPPKTACAVYIALPTTSSTPVPGFKFLGAIGPGKESAVFKIGGLSQSRPRDAPVTAHGEVDMIVPDGADTSGMSGQQCSDITIGISIESADSVAAQIAALSQATTQDSVLGGSSKTLMKAAPNDQSGSRSPDVTILAQRIIKNAFNFLASFSGNANGGVEVVPLKAFEDWWRKFESRVRSDPGFLERGDGD